MKRCYISGPMSNMPAFNVPAFHAAAALLRAQGLEVVNPAEMDESDAAPKEWADYLRRDIKQMMECDGIAMLPGWEDSRGARLESHIAHALGFEVIYIEPTKHPVPAKQAPEPVAPS